MLGSGAERGLLGTGAALPKFISNSHELWTELFTCFLLLACVPRPAADREKLALP